MNSSHRPTPIVDVHSAGVVVDCWVVARVVVMVVGGIVGDVV
jgi:hypothetical protein